MRATLVVFAVLLSVEKPAGAHRLDEYLQATLIAVTKDRVQAEMRLVPGVAVFPIVLAAIDTDHDGIISEAEKQAYAERVFRDLSLSVDGNPLRLRLVSRNYADTEAMKEGLGEIQLEFTADVPRGGSNRKLILENHHQSGIGAYLVNCLVPRDPGIRFIAQHRNYQQSFYELDFEQAGIGPGLLSLAWWSGDRGFLGAAVFFLFARFAWLRRPRFSRQ